MLTLTRARRPGRRTFLSTGAAALAVIVPLALAPPVFSAVPAATAGPATAAVPADASRASSLGPAPAVLDGYACGEWGRYGTSRTCVSTIWGGDFAFTVSPHVARVGERFRLTVKDGTANYGHSWNWGTLPGNAVTCQPKPGVWLTGPSSGSCVVTAVRPTGGWQAASACINPLGQVYCEEDYFAVLDEDTYLVHGTVTNAEDKGVPGVRITFTRSGSSSYAVTRTDGTYGAVLKKGTYSVRAAGRYCPSKGTECENPIEVRVIADKQLDWGPPSSVVLTGHVRDHRGKGLSSVQIVAAAAPSGSRTTDRTDASGAYRMELRAGAYNVRPVPSGNTDRESYQPESKYLEQARENVVVDFTLTPADELDLETSLSRLIAGLWWTTWPANGTGRADATISVENGRGDPVSDETVTIDAPYWDVEPPGSTAPEVLVCDDQWRKVYPGGGFSRTTDDRGEVRFHLFLGGVIGNFFLHSRETADNTVLDVERFGQTGRATGPTQDIVSTLQNATRLGLPAPPLKGATQSAVQEGLIDWLLEYRLATARAMSPWGEFGPIRSAAGAAAVVLYPSGAGGPLRAHLAAGSPLPDGYRTLVIPIKRVVLVGLDTWYVDFGQAGGLKTLDSWEAEHGTARSGFVGRPASADIAWFAGPYPPAATDVEGRAQFDHCAPGAAPQVTRLEVHSPLRLLVTDSAGHRFGHTGSGALVNTLGGYYVPASGAQAATYVVPSGALSVRLTGTGAGTATLVERTGDSTHVFGLRVRRGATGTLRLTGEGAAGTLRFAGTVVRAQQGVRLSLSGAPRTGTAGRALRLALRVTDQFRRPVDGALVTVNGLGVAVRAETDGRGRVTLTVTPTRKGRLQVRAALPGYTGAQQIVRVRARR